MGSHYEKKDGKIDIKLNNETKICTLQVDETEDTILYRYDDLYMSYNKTNKSIHIYDYVYRARLGWHEREIFDSMKEFEKEVNELNINDVIKRNLNDKFCYDYIFLCFKKIILEEKLIPDKKFD